MPSPPVRRGRPPNIERRKAIAAAVTGVFAERGYYGATMRELSHPDNTAGRNRGFQMKPPEPAQLDAALGGNLSANTREAIEAAPAQLHSALILGSPEFMVR